MPQPHAIRQQPARLQAGPGIGPVKPTRGGEGEGRGKFIRFIPCEAIPVGFQQGWPRLCLGEAREDKIARLADGQRAVLFAQRVVEEAGQDMAFLDRRAEPFIETVLRAVMHHPVGAGNQQLGRHGDGARIRHHARRRFIQRQQNVHGDRTGDQRVVPIGRDACRIMRQELRLYVGVDVEKPAHLVLQGQPGAGEGHIQLHLERRRSQHHAADRRRVIMCPGGD